jgi:parallel beta-helix repeat protein
MAILLNHRVGRIFLSITFIVVAVPYALAANLAVPGNYRTIQTAVDDAAPGDTIIIKGGKYRENVIINKPLTLRSEGSSSIVVLTATVPEEPVIKVEDVRDVNIIGLTLQGSNYAGIYLYGSSNGSILDSNVIENRYGIYLESSDNNTLEDNKANLNEYGIYLSFSNRNILKGNGANSNRDKGIVLISSNQNTLIENTVNSNLWNGILLLSSNGNTLKDNRIWKNTYAIVLSDSEDNKLINNSTMRRLYYVLPVALIYLGIVLYLLERKFFFYLAGRSSRKASRSKGR